MSRRVQGPATRWAAWFLAGALPAGPALAQAPSNPGQAYANLGFVGSADVGWSSEADVGSLQPGAHDPKVRGFTVPNAELTLNGAVDPFFQGFTNVVLQLDEAGETGVELEEMFLLSTSLPGNLQLKVGQFFAEFGRQNPRHPHAWGLVDQPLVLGRLLGPDGLRSQGARISWLFPTSWYMEGLLTVMNSGGEAAFPFRSEDSDMIHGGVAAEVPVSNAGDLLVVPRLALSLDLGDTQTVLAGVSGAFGPNNSGPGESTSILGADVYWKWRPVTSFQGFPFVSLQAEALLRRYGAASRESLEDALVTLPRETLEDWGGYAELLWGIRPRWVAGARADVVRGGDASFDSEARADRFRLSPVVTWYPSEFSKIRLQYNFDDRDGLGTDHSVWLQFEFILGAHAAHQF